MTKKVPRIVCSTGFHGTPTLRAYTWQSAVSKQTGDATVAGASRNFCHRAILQKLPQVSLLMYFL
jgi:hypothetical protein